MTPVYSFRIESQDYNKYEILVEQTSSDEDQKYQSFVVEYKQDYSSPNGETSDIVWASWFMDDWSLAKDLAVQNYHLISGDLKEQEEEIFNIDTELLVVHPKNNYLYPADDYSDLVRLLDVPPEDRVVVNLLVNSLGLVVSGNRRTAAIRQLNKKYLELENRRFIPDAPCKCKDFHSISQEIKFLLVHNQYRTLSEQQVAQHLRILLSMDRAKAKQKNRVAKRLKINQDSKEVESVQNQSQESVAEVIKREFGFSSVMAENKIKVANRIEEIEVQDSSLARKLFEVREKVPTNTLVTVFDRLDSEPEIMLRVVDDLFQQVVVDKGNRPAINKLIDKHFYEFQKQKMQAALVQGSKNIQDLDHLTQMNRICDSMGDVTSDNILLPIEWIERSLEFFDSSTIDLDPFSEIEGDNIPAFNRYTIADDGLSQEWFGRIITTPPPSKTIDCLKKLAKEIQLGNIEEAVMFCLAEKLLNKSCASVVERCDLISLSPHSRINFSPSQYLRTKDPAWASKNWKRNVVVLYYGDRANRFSEILGKSGLVQYSSPRRMSRLEWVENLDRDRLEARWFGRKLSIRRKNDLYVPVVDNQEFDEWVSPDPEGAKTICIAIALDKMSSDRTVHEVASEDEDDNVVEQIASLTK